MVNAFPIYHISYMTHSRAVNDAVISAESPKDAKSLLEGYLREHPLNPQYPELSMPEEREFKCEFAENYAHQRRVIYCSQDRHD